MLANNIDGSSVRDSSLCGRRSSRTSRVGARSGARAASTETARRSSTCGVASEIARAASRGARTRWSLVHSTTKGLSAMVLALAHSRGWLDYDERVCTYWPEFAQAGKERITVRQLLAHQAGLFAFDEKVDRDVVADLDRLAEVMARQRPAWEPGERQAYHAISLGFYEGELVRRIDPRHRSLGRFFDEEIATAPRSRLLHRRSGVDPRRAPGAPRATQPLEAADLACRSRSCSQGSTNARFFTGR